jgi:hypothetical protein
MDYRIAYVINLIKTKGKEFEQIRKTETTPEAISDEIEDLIVNNYYV